MAIAREVVGDTGSQEVAQLAETVNHLLLILTNFATTAAGNGLADANLDDALDGLAQAVDTGKDSDSGVNYTGTGLELVGVKSTPVRSKAPRRKTVTMTADSDFI